MNKAQALCTFIYLFSSGNSEFYSTGSSLVMTSVESMEIHNLHFPQQTLWFTSPNKFQWIAYINTLWPSGTIWHHPSWSSMDEERIYIYIYNMSVMTCCLAASSHCLKQCCHQNETRLSIFDHWNCQKYGRGYFSCKIQLKLMSVNMVKIWS